jgi:CBS domain containing-hemolysin-like protein
MVIILLLLSAFFSSAETALTTVNRFRMITLADDGNKRASRVLTITDNPSKMLSTILIGNNIVNLTASSLTTSIAYSFGGFMIGLMTGALTLIILVFGEITPKTLATIYADELSLAYSGIIYVLMKILTPIIFLVNTISLGFLFLLRVDPNKRNDSYTEDEIRTIVHASHEEGNIEPEEKEMINNVFDFGDANAKDIMVPRVHVTFADVNSTYDELIDIFREDKFTRLPVYENTTDNVIGTINMKDLLLYDNTKEFQLRDILRKPFFTYEYKKISELLVEMRQSSYNIAIVLDEYGETSGLITLEDLLEEIVGEIHDEYDENEDLFIQKVNTNEYLIEASINLDDLNDELGTELSSDDYDSLGGFMIERLDRLPKVGDCVVTEEGIRLTVRKVDKNRAETIQMIIPE